MRLRRSWPTRTTSALSAGRRCWPRPPRSCRATTSSTRPASDRGSSANRRAPPAGWTSFVRPFKAECQGRELSHSSSSSRNSHSSSKPFRRRSCTPFPVSTPTSSLTWQLPSTPELLSLRPPQLLLRPAFSSLRLQQARRRQPRRATVDLPQRRCRRTSFRQCRFSRRRHF